MAAAAEPTVTIPAADWHQSQRALAEANRKLAAPQRNGPAGDTNVINMLRGQHAPNYVANGLWGSQPYRLYKALGMVMGKLTEKDCKVEMDCNSKFQKALDETGARPSQSGGPDTLFYPFDLNLLPGVLQQHDSFKEAWGPLVASRAGADPGEVSRALNLPPGVVLRESPMSAYTDSLGGTLVAPPVMGEVAQLMRPIPALQRAGARVVPLPPNGRYVAPKITSPTTGYWLTENVAPTETTLGTGQWGLIAKKLGVLARVPNELYRFAAPAIDAALQADMTRTLELGLDYAALYGAGGSDEPTGLIQYNGANQVIIHTAKVTGANGDTLQPEDGYSMAGKIEERNFGLSAWIFRTQLFAKLIGVRGDAVAIGDQQGPYVQSAFREVGDGFGPTWDGYPVVKSNVVINTRAKGSASNLSEVWGGDWNRFTIGMYGAIEFAMSAQAGTAFAQDQTLIRGILFADVGTPWPGAFIYCTNLITYS